MCRYGRVVVGSWFLGRFHIARLSNYLGPHPIYVLLQDSERNRNTSEPRMRLKAWQARWWTAGHRLTSETRRAWTKSAVLKYAQAQEEASRRTPWVLTSPGRAPDAIAYGLQVLDARAVSDQRRHNDNAAWRNRVTPHLEGLRLTQVTPHDVRTLVVDLAGRYAASTVRDTYGLVRYVFATAQADGLINATPCVRVSLPRRLPEDEVSAASPASVQAISVAIDDRYRLLVWFLAATGCRIGEALALHAEDVSLFSNAQVRISKTVHDDGTFGPTKSRRSRVITLPDWIVPKLRSHLAANHGPLVFPAPSGKPLPVRRFSARYWRPAARLAGFADVTPHQLRHLHATQLIELGRPITEVAARLGHRNSRVTMEVYARWIQPDDSGAAAVVPDYSRAIRAVQE
jgi:integrase